MSRTCSRRRAGRGFTLLEAMVSLVILVIVMTATMTLLFSMRAFAERQSVHMAPRQGARQASDYMTHFLDAAGDLNGLSGNPNAIVARYFVGATERRAVFNNLTATEAGNGLGDEGTDIITVAFTSSPARLPIITNPTNPLNGVGSQMFVTFRGGCSSGDAANLAAFEALTGARPVGAGLRSALLHAIDANGAWQYVEITAYNGSNCANVNDQVIDVTFRPSTDATRYNPPNGPQTGLVPPLFLICGVDYTSFRVRNRVLEQKSSGIDAIGPYPGLFDPTADNPGTRFTPIAENVDDLQVAYLFRTDPTGWQNAGRFDTTTNPPTWTAKTLGAADGAPNRVPPQDPTPTGLQYDAANVNGLRFTLVTRSSPLNISSRKLTQSGGQGLGFGTHGFFRPIAEDHDRGSADSLATGIFERYRMTTTIMLRNRMLGN